VLDYIYAYMKHWRLYEAAAAAAAAAKDQDLSNEILLVTIQDLIISGRTKTSNLPIDMTG
jgi:hypothetical protein